MVLGFQGRSQLEKRYGQDAEAMLSQPATKVFFKTSEPRAAKWISEAIGEIEVERLKESRSASTQEAGRDGQASAGTGPGAEASSGGAPAGRSTGRQAGRVCLGCKQGDRVTRSAFMRINGLM